MRVFRQKDKTESERGSILMEAVICLPVLLLVSLGVAQFAHILLCRTMVHYAAYCAARATLTAPAGSGNERRLAGEAARVVCSTITFINPDPGTNPDYALPGINPFGQGVGAAIDGSGSVRNANVLSVRLIGTDPNPVTDDPPDPVVDQWHRGVEVTMGVPLLFPLAGPVIGRTMDLFAGGSFAPVGRTPNGITTVQYNNEIFPRIKLRERAYIVKPFVSTWSTD